MDVWGSTSTGTAGTNVAVGNVAGRSIRQAPIRKGVVEAAQRLRTNGGKGDPRLQSLNLGGEPICVRGFELLADALKKNVHLRELFIYNTDLGLEGMRALTTALKGNRTLSSLNLGENTMCGDAVQLLVSLLEISPALNQLYIDWGVANASVRTAIKVRLQPDYRLELWRKICGGNSLPPQAYEYIGHHSGKFHVNKEDH
jgi:hypothetical protein